MRTGNYKESVGQIIALSDSKAVWAWIAALIAALIVAPYLVGAYALTLMVSALIAVIGAVGLNLLTGTTGLISLGQAGFLAVGAYTNAILLTDYHLPVWLSLPAAGVAGAARVMGIDLVRYKLLAFVVSSFIVAIASALLSLQIRFVNIDVFALILSIEALAIIILGGLGSVDGAVLGAVFLSYCDQELKSLKTR